MSKLCHVMLVAFALLFLSATYAQLEDTGTSNRLGTNFFIVDPVKDFSTVHAGYRKLLQKYVGQRMEIALSGERNVDTRNPTPAVITLQDGTRLTATYRFRKPKPDATSPGASGDEQVEQSEDDDLMKVSYEDAMIQVSNTLIVETVLPEGKGVVAIEAPLGRNSPFLDSHLKSSSKIMLNLPGRSRGISLGKAYTMTPMGSGICDPGWAKGRIVFRKGRSVGK